MPVTCTHDVEDAELLVGHGALATLRRAWAPVLAEMLRKWLFAGLGYRCVRAAGATLIPVACMDGRTISTTFFFLHPERNGEDIRALGRGT